MIHSSPFPDIDIPTDLSLPDFVFNDVEKYADKTYMIDAQTGYSLTFNQAKQMSYAFAKNLQRHFSFKKGDVVAILLPNVPLYPVFFMGVAMAGGINTTINPLNSESEIHKQLLDSGARFLVTLSLFASKAEPAIQGTKVEKLLFLNQSLVEENDHVMDVMKLFQHPNDTEPLGVTINPKEDLVCLPYSSGTTGLFKGVMVRFSFYIELTC
jgi:acyl-CoA synthetase (AMP-forming)/AMP-acid ligase II